jgi:hypothetical protein
VVLLIVRPFPLNDQVLLEIVVLSIVVELMVNSPPSNMLFAIKTDVAETPDIVTFAVDADCPIVFPSKTKLFIPVDVIFAAEKNTVFEIMAVLKEEPVRESILTGELNIQLFRSK